MAQVRSGSAEAVSHGLQAPGADAASNGTVNELAPNLTFELFNDVLISLPTRECLTIERNASDLLSRKALDNQLCFIDWTQARMISSGGDVSNLITTNSLSAEQFEAANLYLDESNFRHQQADSDLMSHQMIERSGSLEAPLVSDLLRRLTSNKGQFYSDTSPLDPALDETNHHLSRLTYLSAGSLLSLLGILMNFLILLIIFINTKQKCHNILSRGRTSHTNYHHLLLFQLTLTGLLLGGYILIDNINLYNGITNNADGINSDLHQDNREAPIFSPLSIYLPPTPFKFAARTSTDSLSSEQQPTKRHLLRQPRRPASGEISSFAIYLEARKRHQNRGTRKRVQMVSSANLVLITCGSSSRQQLDQNQDPSEESESSHPQIGSMSMFFNFLATIHLWTVVALAYDRYCAIAHPLEYLRAINETKARTFLLILWCASTLMNVFLPLALEAKLTPESSPMASNQSISRFKITGELLGRNLHEDLLEEEYFCSARSVAPNMHVKQDADMVQFVHFLIGLSARQTPSGIDPTRQQQAYLLIALSLLTFLMVILAPLVIITICNVSIYGIVKVHERRMSVSSGSLGGAYVGIGAFGSSSSSTLSHGRCVKRDSLLTNNTELANERSETCSIGSSILGKLIRASAQVGAMGGILISASKEDTSSQCSSSTSEHEISQLIGSDDNREESRNITVQSVDGGGHRAAMSSHYLPNGNCYKTKLDPIERSQPTSCSFVARLTRRRQRLGSVRQKRPSSPQRSSDFSSASIRPQTRDTILKKKLKRKLSDREQGGSQSRACSRKSSFAPSEPTLIMQEAGCPLAGGGDNCSCHSNQSGTSKRQSRLQLQQQLQADSDGIMRQLKMAGLSFAGIAISELMASRPDHSRTLHRSSSWSLGNMNSMTNNRQQQQQINGLDSGTQAGPAATFQFCPASSRCVTLGNKQPALVEQQAPAVREKRHSYVSVLQQRDLWQEKFCTKLLFDSDSESHGHQQTQTSCSRNSQQQQYFNLGGTKSVAFNVVIWLILLMLTFTLPRYSLSTIDQIFQVGRWASNALGDRLRANLTLLSELIEANDSPSAATLDGPVKPSMADEIFVWLRATSIWFDCICRLLFLLMLPLNGWLYGIRSRSLRTTLKMVLKRYISKKQASIEINQRRKSVVSMRSRESSVCCTTTNAQPASLCSHSKVQSWTPVSGVAQQQQQNEFPNGRVFRRCSSFNLPPQTRQDYYNSINKANKREMGSDQEQQARRSHNSSIRFVLNDSHHHESAVNKRWTELDSSEARAGAHLSPSNGIANCLLPIPALMSNRCSTSQISSLDSSSLAGSHRSLLSASIQSSQSAALLLLDQRNLAAENQPTREQPPANRPTKLTGVLKKRATNPMHHQESYDSATSGGSRPSPSSCSGVLKNPSTSAKSALHQQAHHQTSGLAVSFGRTQSLDRDNSFESALNRARRVPDTGEQSISTSSSVVPIVSRHRMRKSAAVVAPPPAPVHNIERDESQNVHADAEMGEERLIRGQQSVSRRPSSDIKFMLTSAGDQAETKLLLHVEHQQAKAEVQEVEESRERESPVDANANERSEAHAINLFEDSHNEFKQISLNQTRPDQIGYKLDYYKQLKLAISKYFFSLKRRRLESGSSCNQLDGGAKRSKLLRQHSDVTNSIQRQLSIACSMSNQVGLCNQAHGQLCGCCTASHVPKFSLAHGSSRLRRNSLDSNTQKLAILQQQLEAQSALAEKGRHAAEISTHQVINRSASNQSISSNGSTKSDQLHNSQHRLQVGQLQLRHKQQHQPPQGSHLKPPNFLKLIFEPEGQAAALYSSSLALSPIKECSSNHSWASSQSSLALGNGNANVNGLQRKSSAASGNGSVAKSLVEV